MYNLFQLGLNEYKLEVHTKQLTFSVKQKVRYNHNSIFNKKKLLFQFWGVGVFFLIPVCLSTNWG